MIPMPALRRLRDVLLVSALFTAPLLAAETTGTKKEEPQKPKKEEVAQLDDVVVTETASRVVENVRDVPQTVRVIDSEEIERRQPTIPIEMLKEQPGIWAPNVETWAPAWRPGQPRRDLGTCIGT